MQVSATLRIRAPSLPGGKKIQAKAEAGLDDDEALRSAPARIVTEQAIAGKKHVPRLRQTAGGGMIDIVILGRVRRVVCGKRKLCRSAGQSNARFAIPDACAEKV